MLYEVITHLQHLPSITHSKNAHMLKHILPDENKYNQDQSKQKLHLLYHEPPNNFRITSYNVCYTKLLRCKLHLIIVFCLVRV